MEHHGTVSIEIHLGADVFIVDGAHGLSDPDLPRWFAAFLKARTPSQQASIDRLAADLDRSSTALHDAVTAATPPAHQT